MGEHIAHARPPRGRGRRIFWNTVGVIGELLITASFVIGLFAVWQLYWTTFQVQGQVAQTITAYEEDHAPVARQAGEARTDAPPAFTREVSDGEVYGLVHVPSWDWMKIPLAEGTTSAVLDNGWAGHYGNNFRWIDRLGEGDKVVAEVDDFYVVYSVQTWEIISADDPDQVRVIAPVIDDLTFNKEPTERWMTMTTCNPEYGNWERYIVHLKFQSWTPKSSGVPAELLDEPES